jgi:hypothetical protein
MSASESSTSAIHELPHAIQPTTPQTYTGFRTQVSPTNVKQTLPSSKPQKGLKDQILTMLESACTLDLASLNLRHLFPAAQFPGKRKTPEQKFKPDESTPRLSRPYTQGLVRSQAGAELCSSESSSPGHQATRNFSLKNSRRNCSCNFQIRFCSSPD